MTIDLESLRAAAVASMLSGGCHKAADHLRRAPRVGTLGWVAAWHATIERCDQDVTYVADGGDDCASAVEAMMGLERALWSHHELTHRQAVLDAESRKAMQAEFARLNRELNEARQLAAELQSRLDAQQW